MSYTDRLKKSIRTIPDYPIKGILFRDITTLMIDSSVFSESCDRMVEAAGLFSSFEYVAGIEARGFIYGSVLSSRMAAGFVPIRKPGKLPASTISVEYDLEYGKDSIEVHKDAIIPGERYLVVDDLLATGGTAEAACRLIELGDGIVVGCLFLVELPGLGGRRKLGDSKVISLLEFDGE